MPSLLFANWDRIKQTLAAGERKATGDIEVLFGGKRLLIHRDAAVMNNLRLTIITTDHSVAGPPFRYGPIRSVEFPGSGKVRLHLGPDEACDWIVEITSNARFDTKSP